MEPCIRHSDDGNGELMAFQCTVTRVPLISAEQAEWNESNWKLIEMRVLKLDLQF